MFFIYNSNGNNKQSKTLKTIKIILSIVLIIMGVLCILNPLGTVATMETIAAVFILSTGMFRGYEYLSYSKQGAKYPSLLTSCVLNLVLGIVFLILPSGFTVSFVTGLITIILLVVGLVKIMSALKKREYNEPGWKTNMVFGIIILLVAIAFLSMPLATDILLVVSLGCYLVFCGISLLAFR